MCELLAINSSRPVRFDVLDRGIAALSVGNKLNLVIDDGAFIYVHTNYLKESLFLLPDGGTAVCSTHPLQDGPWSAVPQHAWRLCATGKSPGKAPRTATYTANKPKAQRISTASPKHDRRNDNHNREQP